ncbi:MAG: DUF1311 domain-containing protein [Flavobacteriaceae bacterium]|nr:DUF1311 domain-containing protein [Flavobacteriaceae bacterium]
MKEILTTILFLVTLTSLSQTQLKMNKELNDSYSTTDNELNSVYNQILSEYKNDTNFIKKLKSSQILWIKFRDAELEMKFPESDKKNYGSMYPMCASGYLMQLTKERTEKLKDWLRPIPEEEGCVGSIKYRVISKANISIEMIENYEIQGLLNGLKILKEFKTSELSVRIIELGNLSGSAGFTNGEITHDLFFAISEFDELPEQNLFRVSEFYNPKVESIDYSDIKKPVIEISFGSSSEREKIRFELTINELIKTSR